MNKTFRRSQAVFYSRIRIFYH